MELCSGKFGAGLSRGCGCGVVLLAIIHGRVGEDTLLTGSKYWSELKIENLTGTGVKQRKTATAE